MEQKIIFKAMNIGKQWYNNEAGECIFLYEDGTWEIIFKYTNANRCFNLNQIHGLTKEQGIAKLKSYYNDGKAEGYFKD